MPCDRFVLVVRTAIQTDSPPNFCGFSDRDRNVVDLNILQAAKKGFPRGKLQGFQMSCKTKGEAFDGSFILSSERTPLRNGLIRAKGTWALSPLLL